MGKADRAPGAKKKRPRADSDGEGGEEEPPGKRPRRRGPDRAEEPPPAVKKKRARADSDGEGEEPSGKRPRRRGPDQAAVPPPAGAGTIYDAYADTFASARAWLAERTAELVRAEVPRPLWQQAAASAAAGEGRANKGDERFAAVRRTLSEFRDPDGDLYERSETQVMFHDHMLNAAIQVRAAAPAPAGPPSSQFSTSPPPS